MATGTYASVTFEGDKAIKHLTHNNFSINDINIPLTYKHPNIMDIKGWTYNANEVQITMLKGALYYNYIDANPNVSIDQRLIYCYQLASAIKFLINNNIWYCDIKHNNIVIRENNLYLIDFGKIRTTGKPPGGTCNNIGYQPPEWNYFIQIDNDINLNKGAIYALGMIFFYILYYGNYHLQNLWWQFYNLQNNDFNLESRKIRNEDFYNTILQRQDTLVFKPFINMIATEESKRLTFFQLSQIFKADYIQGVLSLKDINLTIPKINVQLYLLNFFFQRSYIMQHYKGEYKKINFQHLINFIEIFRRLELNAFTDEGLHVIELILIDTAGIFISDKVVKRTPEDIELYIIFSNFLQSNINSYQYSDNLFTYKYDTNYHVSNSDTELGDYLAKIKSKYGLSKDCLLFGDGYFYIIENGKVGITLTGNSDLFILN